MRSNLALAMLLGSSLLVASAPDGAEDERQPGILKLSGVDRQERVMVDSEEVPPAGLERARYRLLLAPGPYVVTLQTSTGKTCSHRVQLEEHQTVTVQSCAAPASNSVQADD